METLSDIPYYWPIVFQESVRQTDRMSLPVFSHERQKNLNQIC